MHDGMSAGELVMDLYDHLVEGNTFAPTFYMDFPLETSPLTRTHRTDPRLSERWDLVAFGMEIGTAYSELIDPVDQRARLTEQSLRAAAGDEEAMEIDEEFLGAMELGMPPTGGLGIGRGSRGDDVDRHAHPVGADLPVRPAAGQVRRPTDLRPRRRTTPRVAHR